MQDSFFALFAINDYYDKEIDAINEPANSIRQVRGLRWDLPSCYLCLLLCFTAHTVRQRNNNTGQFTDMLYVQRFSTWHLVLGPISTIQTFCQPVAPRDIPVHLLFHGQRSGHEDVYMWFQGIPNHSIHIQWSPILQDFKVNLCINVVPGACA